MKRLKFKLEIECDNAAFEGVPGFEVAKILREAAVKLEHGYTPAIRTGGIILRDTNGHRVGIAGFMNPRK